MAVVRDAADAASQGEALPLVVGEQGDGDLADLQRTAAVGIGGQGGQAQLAASRCRTWLKGMVTPRAGEPPGATFVTAARSWC